MVPPLSKRSPLEGSYGRRPAASGIPAGLHVRRGAGGRGAIPGQYRLRFYGEVHHLSEAGGAGGGLRQKPQDPGRPRGRPDMPFLITIPSVIRYWYQTARAYRGKQNKPYEAIWFERLATEIGERVYNVKKPLQ